jgi:hypothetical protein
MPACSKAAIIDSIVLSFSDSPRSNLAIVSGETLAAWASSRTPHPMAALAILHCTGDIRNIDTISLVD